MLLCGSALALVPVTATAFDLDFRAQGQVVLLGGMSLPDPGFGIVEAQVNASMWSFGVAAGLAYDRFPVDGGGVAHGGEFHAALQWRFLALVNDWLYGYLDPHVDLGFVLGGGRTDEASWFRGAGYGGLGVDLRLAGGDQDVHPVFTIQYRWSPTGVHTPDAAPDHLLLFGLGIRAGDMHAPPADEGD
jgi:hypothetical protein